MGQALYRKYRSKNFDEVIGQDHITTTIRNAIKNGRLSHAYLFTGPRGVGKTTVARLLAHEVNGLSYTGEDAHLDIIEIDAASNTGVDDVRDLKEKVRVSPTSGKYKVYIIDEVHMLSKSAFNALLKTLEEPPAHVIFILATTEAHKLPDTIISRAQRFEFKPIDHNSAVTHLKKIADAEKISIDQEALELLAHHGAGSFRDSINLMDQISGSGGKISGSIVRDFLGLPSSESIELLAEAVDSANQSAILANLDELSRQGVAPDSITAALARKLRQQIISGGAQPWNAHLLKSLIEVPASVDVQAALEITLLGSASERSAPEQGQKAPVSINKTHERPPAEPEKQREPEKKTMPPKGFDQNAWNDIVGQVKTEAPSLYTVLRLATPRQEGEELILAFTYPLHKKKMEQAAHKDVVARITQQITGKKLTVKGVVEKTDGSDEKPAAQLETISNIFGQTEMLES